MVSALHTTLPIMPTGVGQACKTLQPTWPTSTDVLEALPAEELAGCEPLSKDGNRFSKDGNPFFRRMGDFSTEGWETIHRGMGTPFSKDGNPASERWEPLLPRDRNGFCCWTEAPIPMDGDLFSRGMGPLFQGMGNPFRKMGAPFPRNGKPFAEGWAHIFREM